MSVYPTPAVLQAEQQARHLVLGWSPISFFRLVVLSQLGAAGFDFLEHLVGGDVAQLAVGVELLFIKELVAPRRSVWNLTAPRRSVWNLTV